MLSPFLRPFSLMLKPAGPRCNLACRYCYYLDKQALYPDAARAVTMSDEVLEEAVHQYIEAQPTQEVVFVWHGGEPTLLPISFYRKAMRLQQRYAAGHLISNCLQTNGTLLTPEWCQFLHDNEWLVGISIDGNAVMHDAYRRTRGGGETHPLVLRGIGLLQQYDVQWNAMAVVNRLNADQPEAFYRYLKQIGCRYIQFAPIVEHTPDGAFTPETVSPEQWGEFCCRLFDEWLRCDDIGQVFVQLFDAVLANWVGVTPGVCTLGVQCGHALAMEANGDVYSCDHFVDRAHLLGNVLDRTLADMVEDARQRSFGSAKESALPDECRACRWLSLCNGECPKNRLPSGRNYLCEGYRRFFAHSAPVMQQLRQEILDRENGQ